MAAPRKCLKNRVSSRRLRHVPGIKRHPQSENLTHKFAFPDILRKSFFSALQKMLSRKNPVLNFKSRKEMVMIGSGFTVRVHPVVILSIVDSYERRESRGGCCNKAIGTLLGYYEKNAVEVVNCYGVKYSESKDEASIDRFMNKEMFELNRASNPHEAIVGWYSTSDEISNASQLFHDYYMEAVPKKASGRDVTPVVHLIVDVNKEGEDLGIEAFVLQKVKVPQSEGFQSLLLVPVRLQLIASEVEKVGLAALTKSSDFKTREVELVRDLEQVRKCLSDLIKWIGIMRQYVTNVLDGKIVGDTEIGRQLSETISQWHNITPGVFNAMISSGLKDFLMLTYLTELSQTQLTLQDKFLNL